MNMETDQIVRKLRAKAREIMSHTHQEIVARLAEPEIIDFGEPAQPEGDEYYQVQTEILDRFAEGSANVLHIPITLRTSARMLSTELFLYSDGRVKWNGTVHEYNDGVPTPVTQLVPE
jgi:hypothetical protein